MAILERARTVAFIRKLVLQVYSLVLRSFYDRHLVLLETALKFRFIVNIEYSLFSTFNLPSKQIKW